MLQAQKLSAAALKYSGLNIESLDNTVLATIINKKVENITAIKDYNHSEEAKKFNQFLKDYYSKNPVEEKAQDSEKIDDSSELEQ